MITRVLHQVAAGPRQTSPCPPNPSRSHFPVRGSRTMAKGTSGGVSEVDLTDVSCWKGGRTCS